MNVKSQSNWSVFRKMLLALPFLLLIAITVPQAHADDHHRSHRGYHRDRGHYREYRHHGRQRGYYHDGRYYGNRREYYRGGHRYYRYYGILPDLSISIGR